MLMRDEALVGSLAKRLLGSSATSGLSPEEALRQLDSYGIEWYVTEKGDLMIRYWQVGAEDFVPIEHIARIRDEQDVPAQAEDLEALSRNLAAIRDRYRGQWIALAHGSVVASAENLPDLLCRVEELDVAEPFVTQVPDEPVSWNMAYVSQGI